MSLSAASTQKLMREFRSLMQSPPEGIRIQLHDDNITNVMAEIDGPVGTPFEGNDKDHKSSRISSDGLNNGNITSDNTDTHNTIIEGGGLFRCKLVLGGDFPASPPKAHFLTKLFHPNVSSTGEICVNTLKKDWDPSHGIKHVLLVIRCLLIYPNPESALNQEAGKLLLENYEDYQKRAALMTRIHAKGKSTITSESETLASTPTSTTTSTSTSSSIPVAVGEKENTDAKQNHSNQQTSTSTPITDSPAKKVKVATTSTSKPIDKEAQAKLLKKKSLKRL